MKVYSVPAELRYEPDYSGLSAEHFGKQEDSHKSRLKDYLKNTGYTSKNTGREFGIPHADGYARYMLAEGPGEKTCLIHLPYGDAWHSPLAPKLTKKEVMERIKLFEGVSELFAC